MKVRIIFTPYPPPPREVVVTMSEEEARRLYREQLGLGDLFQALYDAGIR